MTTRLYRFFALSLVVSLAAISTQSLAEGNTVYLSENSTATGQKVNLVLPVSGSAYDYFSGSLNITTGASLKQDGSIANGTSFLAYCIDPFQWSSTSPLAYSTAALSTLGTGREANVSKLYSQSFASTSGNSDNSAAFQLALWELAKDDGKLNEGKVHITNNTDRDIVTLASSMISNVKNSVAGPNQYSFNLYTNGKNQDYLVATMTSVTPVPEPETYAMLLAGLGLIGFTASRRRVSKES